jgi:hypothetical protein
MSICLYCLVKKDSNISRGYVVGLRVISSESSHGGCVSSQVHFIG